MTENKSFQEEDARRKELRAQVIMPDTEEHEMHVDGAKELRRNGLVMIMFGILLIFGPIILMVITGRLFWVLPIVGMFSVGIGTKQWLQSHDN